MKYFHVPIFQEPKDRTSGSGVLNLWRRKDLRMRSLVSCVIWASFGFMYYGVILLSSKIMGESDECSFDYSILFFASSRYVRVALCHANSTLCCVSLSNDVWQLLMLLLLLSHGSLRCYEEDFASLLSET